MMDMRTKILPEDLSFQLHLTSRHSLTPLKFAAVTISNSVSNIL